jgi:hypothetical protein
MLVTPFTNVNQELQNAPRPEVGDIDIVTGEKQSPGLGLFYSLERFGPDLFTGLSYLLRSPTPNRQL